MNHSIMTCNVKFIIPDFLKGNTTSFRFISKTTVEENSKDKNAKQFLQKPVLKYISNIFHSSRIIVIKERLNSFREQIS